MLCVLLQEFLIRCKIPDMYSLIVRFQSNCICCPACELLSSKLNFSCVFIATGNRSDVRRSRRPQTRFATSCMFVCVVIELKIYFTLPVK